jgi:hypothetical protein
VHDTLDKLEPTILAEKISKSTGLVSAQEPLESLSSGSGQEGKCATVMRPAPDEFGRNPDTGSGGRSMCNQRKRERKN